MTEYTNKQDLLNNFDEADCDVHEPFGDEYCEFGFSRPLVRSIIEETTTIDVMPVRHGHWICPNDDLIACICSVCGWRGHFYEDDVSYEPFCPHCGATLDEEVESY